MADEDMAGISSLLEVGMTDDMRKEEEFETHHARSCSRMSNHFPWEECIDFDGESVMVVVEGILGFFSTDAGCAPALVVRVRHVSVVETLRMILPSSRDLQDVS